MKKLFLVFGVMSLLISSVTQGVAKDYKIGTVFNNVFKIDFPAGRKSVPLPPGDWKLTYKVEWTSNPNNVRIIRFDLVRHTSTFLTGVMSITTPKDIVDYFWTISNACSGKNSKRSWHFYEDSYNQHEDCNLVYPIRGWNRKSKNLKKSFEYIDNRNLTIPNAWVLVRYVRSEDADLLKVSYGLPQENYGFPREQKYSNTESPWNVNNIDAFPKKKAFMEKAVAWAKSWKKLIEKGFKNELRTEEVINHLRIDGNILPILDDCIRYRNTTYCK